MVRGGHRQGLYAAIAFVVAAAIYLPSLSNGFAYDDVPLLLGDPRIRAGEGIRALLVAPYWYGAGLELALYRPLTTLSFALDWSLAGGVPTWCHLVNIILHAGATALVFLLLREYFAPRAALLGALIFAVHPVHTEAVANVAGRSELLAATFFLAACLDWVRLGESSRSSPRGLTVPLLAALAISSKESAIILPAVLVLLDFGAGRWSPQRRSILHYVRSTGPLLGGVVLVFIGYLAARAAVVGLHSPAIHHPAAEIIAGPGPRLLTALQAWPEYLRLLFFPRTLLIDYGPQVIMPANTITSPGVLGLLILATLLGSGGLALVRGRRYAALALLWFPITILPVSNLIFTIGVLVAERTLYLPSFALSLAVAAGLTLASTERSASHTSRIRRGAWPALALVLAVLSARTLQRIPEWESTERIFLAQVRDRPDSYRGHWYLGRAARVGGDTTRAAAHFAEALRLWPYREGLVLEAAAFAIERDRIGEARQLAAFATERWPDNVEGWRLLAATALDLGDITTAWSAVAEGLRIDPRDDLLERMRRAILEKNSSEGVTGGQPDDEVFEDGSESY
jgi:tetratricopeptide (TPR) repeat protein